MSSEKSRRAFIIQSLKATGGLLGGTAALSTLSACSTFDEYLFEDTFLLNDQTVIVGGGISGMYFASLLRENKTVFRLFEGSTRLGGRIRSARNFDYGASLYTEKDELVKALVKKYSLNSQTLEKGQYYLANGMQSLTDALYQQIAGLIVYKSVRLRWKLISVQKINNLYETVFEGPQGRRTYVTKKLVLAIPPNQWSGVAGLAELPEMKKIMTWAQSIRRENTVKVILTPQQLFNYQSSAKNLTEYADENYRARQIIKKTKSGNWIEIDVKSKNPEASIEIEKINDFIKKKLNVSFSTNRMTAENYFDWNRVNLIRGSGFIAPTPMPELKSSYFQVIGDFASLERPGQVEGALSSAARAAELIV